MLAVYVVALGVLLFTAGLTLTLGPLALVGCGAGLMAAGLLVDIERLR